MTWESFAKATESSLRKKLPRAECLYDLLGPALEAANSEVADLCPTEKLAGCNESILSNLKLGFAPGKEWYQNKAPHLLVPSAFFKDKHAQYLRSCIMLPDGDIPVSLKISLDENNAPCVQAVDGRGDPATCEVTETFAEVVWQTLGAMETQIVTPAKELLMLGKAIGWDNMRQIVEQSAALSTMLGKGGAGYQSRPVACSFTPRPEMMLEDLLVAFAGPVDGKDAAALEDFCSSTALKANSLSGRARPWRMYVESEMMERAETALAVIKDTELKDGILGALRKAGRTLNDSVLDADRPGFITDIFITAETHSPDGAGKTLPCMGTDDVLEILAPDAKEYIWDRGQSSYALMHLPQDLERRILKANAGKKPAKVDMHYCLIR